MLGGDQRRLRLAYSLMFSLPGAPMLFYGNEIGMGENLTLEGRLSVRTPMQWTAYNNGGFSTASPKHVVRPLVSNGAFGFERVNVSAQRTDPDSLLNWMAGLIRTRRECGEIGSGTWRILPTGDDAIFCLRYDVEDSSIFVLNNLSRERRTVKLDLSNQEIETATDLFSDRPYEPIEAGSLRVQLDGSGYRWLRLGGIY
jgi:maltose alpha-D-glucosyltransferase/alpha-amylase